jgi:hypothetical protein
MPSNEESEPPVTVDPLFAAHDTLGSCQNRSALLVPEVGAEKATVPPVLIVIGRYCLPARQGTYCRTLYQFRLHWQ